MELKKQVGDNKFPDNVIYLCMLQNSRNLIGECFQELFGTDIHNLIQCNSEFL